MDGRIAAGISIKLIIAQTGSTENTRASTGPPTSSGKKCKLQDDPKEKLPIKRPNGIDATWRLLSLNSPHFLAAKYHVEALIEYGFNKVELLLEAMYPLKKRWARTGSGLVLEEGNYRLALIRDAVLKLAILDARYDLPELNGTTDRKVQGLVSDENLANVADAHGIAGHIAGWYHSGYEPPKKLKATTIEAIVGVVWFDFGKDLEVVKRILPSLLGERLDDHRDF